MILLTFNQKLSSSALIIPDAAAELIAMTKKAPTF